MDKSIGIVSAFLTEPYVPYMSASAIAVEDSQPIATTACSFKGERFREQLYKFTHIESIKVKMDYVVMYSDIRLAFLNERNGLFPKNKANAI